MQYKNIANIILKSQVVFKSSNLKGFVMFRRSIHTGKVLQSSKVWSKFGQRSKALGIQSEPIKKCILEGTSSLGPPSLKRRSNRIKYSSPEKIDETFKVCYEFLESKAGKVYEEASQTEDPVKREEILTEAELNNPEVQYNFQFHDKLNNNPAVIDYNQPVYRHLGKKHWESYSQMLVMQRLETLAVIPDTLPTLVPRVEVNVKFPYSTGVNKWIEPGEVLSSNSTSFPPVFKIQEYELVNTKDQYYTILVVNPDEPDLAKNSYKTTLNFGLINIKLDYNDNIVDPRKYNESNIIADYVPPVPEKNAGKQRYSVWVFRQTPKTILTVDKDSLKRNNFNIKDFCKQNSLTPVGAHVWRSEWDSNVDATREKYGLPAGRVFSRVRSA